MTTPPPWPDPNSVSCGLDISRDVATKLRGFRNKVVAATLLTGSVQTMRSASLDTAISCAAAISPADAQPGTRSVGFRIKTTTTTWQRKVF